MSKAEPEEARRLPVEPCTRRAAVPPSLRRGRRIPFNWPTELQPGYLGMRSTSPNRIRSASSKPLRSKRAGTVTPNRRAIPVRVSPAAT